MQRNFSFARQAPWPSGNGRSPTVAVTPGLGLCQRGNIACKAVHSAAKPNLGGAAMVGAVRALVWRKQAYRSPSAEGWCSCGALAAGTAASLQ